MSRSNEITKLAPPGRTTRWMQVAWAAASVLLCAALPAQSQTTAAPKYYEAKDLGAVSQYRPLGCIARNGKVALTRRLYESPYGWNDRAIVHMGSSDDFELFYEYGRDTWVQGCNSKGEYIGFYAGAPVIWDVQWTSGPQFLPDSQKVGAQLFALNDSRQVVGSTLYDNDANGTDVYATLWITSQAPEDTQVTMKKLFIGEAVAINSLGQIAGTRTGLAQGKRAVFVANSAASPTALLPPDGVSSQATGIDEEGQVVGQYVDTSGRQTGFVWYRHLGYILLGPARLRMSQLQHSLPRAISSHGMAMVVGQSYSMKFGSVVNRQATVWPQAGTARNLNNEASMANGAPLTVTLTDAIGVADDGSVLCEGWTSDGVRRAVLLKPRVGGSWS